VLLCAVVLFVAVSVLRPPQNVLRTAAQEFWRIALILGVKAHWSESSVEALEAARLTGMKWRESLDLGALMTRRRTGWRLNRALNSGL